MTGQAHAWPALSGPLQLLAFRLDGQRHAVPLAAVERVVSAVEVTPLPGAPPAVLGFIDAGGAVMPVFCLRRRLQLSQRDIIPADQFLIVRAGRRLVALVIDEAQGLVDCDGAAVEQADMAVVGQSQVQGLLKLADGLLLIHDLSRFLSLPEERALEQAMEAAG